MSQADAVSTSPLPPGVTEAALSRALDGFTAALGADRVLTSDADLREFRDPFQHATWDTNTASAVVMPTTVEEIQEVLRVANEHKVPLWTHGTGRNNGYGGPAPRVRGSVIVSLRNMNRVLEINEECAYAVVEPGVRWFDLYEAIQAGGHRLMLSHRRPRLGQRRRQHARPRRHLPALRRWTWACSAGWRSCSPTATVMRTGMGAMPDNKSWHVYKRGLGPTPDQLFMQSNFGIVTKMGVWLMPYPEVYMPLWLRVWKDDDLAPVIETLRTLMLDGTIRMVPQIINTVLLGSVFSKRDAVVAGARADPRRDHRPDGARARDRALVHALRALRRRGRRRPPLRQDQGGLRAHRGRRGLGRQVRARGHPRPRAPGRAHPGRRAEPRVERDDGLVRRRGGRPHRLLARSRR